jgi:hypothetical protein
MSVTMRQEVERKIAAAFIETVLAKPYLSISVHDGEELVLRRSRDKSAILAAMFSVDEEKLYVCADGIGSIGWAFFVYGNDGWDVISDYTTNLQEFMGEADKISDHYSADPKHDRTTCPICAVPTPADAKPTKLRAPLKVIQALEAALKRAKMDGMGLGDPFHHVTFDGKEVKLTDLCRDETRIYRESWLIPNIELALAWAKGESISDAIVMD